MEKVLVSACLMGHKVRYDADDARHPSAILRQWQSEGRIVTACPEMAGGLPCPRKPSEILSDTGRVIMNDGTDVTKAFHRGAEQTLQICRKNNIRMAVLKENSPSCGVKRVYDGRFSGRKIKGMGITSALLKKNGIAVFSDEEIEMAASHLKRLENQDIGKPERN